MSPDRGRLLKQYNAEFDMSSLWKVSGIVLLMGIQVYGLFDSPRHSILQVWLSCFIVGWLLLLGVRYLNWFNPLRVYEQGILARTEHGKFFFPWRDIHDFTVRSSLSSERVALNVEPTLQIGRVVLLYYTHRLPASELARQLREFLPKGESPPEPAAAEKPVGVS